MKRRPGSRLARPALRLTLVLGCVLAGSSAYAERPYQGVTPGASATPNRGAAKNPRLTWIGYETRADGSARVFCQLTGEVTYQGTSNDQGYHLVIEGARFANRHTPRRLDTRFFGSAVREIRGRRSPRQRARGDQPAHAAGVVIDITYKSGASATPEVTLQREADGYYYLYASFPSAGTTPASTDEDGQTPAAAEDAS